MNNDDSASNGNADDEDSSDRATLPVHCKSSSDDRSAALLPQKRYYRQRAHSNPICDHIFDV